MKRDACPDIEVKMHGDTMLLIEDTQNRDSFLLTREGAISLKHKIQQALKYWPWGTSRPQRGLSTRRRR